MARAAAVLVAAALALTASCTRKPKRTLRTEPWPAPVLAASGLSVTRGKPLSYRLENSTIRFELPARKGKPVGTLKTVEGEIELDPVHLEKTRATLKADLLSLSVGKKEQEEDPELLARAFDWLELSAMQPAEERERNRYAVFEIAGFEPLSSADERSDRGPSRVVAHGTLTLHHFRVPVSTELDVQLLGSRVPSENVLVIRTRRPLVVSLAAHDILPRDGRGALLSEQLKLLGTEIGREARVSVELRARLAATAAGSQP